MSFLRTFSGHTATAALLAGIFLSTGTLSQVNAEPVVLTSNSPSCAEAARLREKVAPLLASADDIALRKNSPELFRLIDVLLALGENDEAEQCLARVLKANVWAFDYQLTYGELLAKKGDTAALRMRAHEVLRYAENDATLRRAQDLLGNSEIAPVPALDTDTFQPPELILVKIDGVSDYWLADLRDAIASALGIKVTVARLPVDSGVPERTAISRLAQRSRQWLLDIAAKDEPFSIFLDSCGLGKEMIARDDDVALRAMRLVLKETGQAKAVEDFDAQVHALENAAPQWDASKLLDRVKQNLTPRITAGVWFIAVTERDIFTENSNFVFGMAQNGGCFGLVSALRFSAAFNEEFERRDRLISRLLKQSLSSFGFILGVGRCTSPMCARAYPHSLAEHDNKPEQLCPDCAQAFQRALGKLPRAAEASGKQ